MDVNAALGLQAGGGMGQSPVCVAPVPCHLPQHHCMCLGNISKSTSEIDRTKESLS
ncbi:unnamed protein product, partial [Vitis vinifera]|uniref:Uncharacterized protein n=1 Tax=Vitis vinifera TaxID=29760 RepID=E0CVQ4_VITVI